LGPGKQVSLRRDACWQESKWNWCGSNYRRFQERVRTPRLVCEALVAWATGSGQYSKTLMWTN